MTSFIHKTLQKGTKCGMQACSYLSLGGRNDGKDVCVYKEKEKNSEGQTKKEENGV